MDGGVSHAGAIAQELGLSQRTVGRHLAVLHTYGLVKLQPSSGNGRVYALDRQRAALLNAAFLSLMGRMGSEDASASADGASPEETLSLVASETPEACTKCQNASFVLEVLDELDRSLAKAQQYEARLRQMASLVVAAQDEERKRVARELHDETAQALASVLVRLRLLGRSARSKRLQADLADLRQLTAATLEGVRRLAIDLRPPMLDDLGLEETLRAHLQDVSRRSSIKAAFTSSRLGRLPRDVELAVFRVVQEALSNIGKHADAAQVAVRLSRTGRTLRLVIEDDGRGFDARSENGPRGGGLGLFGIEERLALVGGTLRVESSLGRGTRVLAEIPLPPTRGGR